jgi:hypothetical protein
VAPVLSRAVTGRAHVPRSALWFMAVLARALLAAEMHVLWLCPATTHWVHGTGSRCGTISQPHFSNLIN